MPGRREHATEAIHPRIVGPRVVKARRDQVRAAYALAVHAHARVAGPFREGPKVLCSSGLGLQGSATDLPKLVGIFPITGYQP